MRVKQRERAFRTSTMLCILAVCLSLALALCSPRSDAADLSVSTQVVPSHRTFYAVCKLLGLTLETVGSLTKPIFMSLALEPIINGDSLLRDGYFSVVVEWRSARTLRMVRR